MIVNYPVPLYGSRAPEVSDGFHLRSSGKFHYGVDIFYRRNKSTEPKGLPWSTENYIMFPDTPAVAVGPGIVSRSEDQSKGGYVQIDHGDGTRSGYRHLSPRKVSLGEHVSAGQIVGIIGEDPTNSGDACHLHFEYEVNGNLVDPEPYITGSVAITTPGFMNSEMAMKVAFVVGAGYLVYALLS